MKRSHMKGRVPSHKPEEHAHRIGVAIMGLAVLPTAAALAWAMRLAGYG